MTEEKEKKDEGLMEEHGSAPPSMVAVDPGPSSFSRFPRFGTKGARPLLLLHCARESVCVCVCARCALYCFVPKRAIHQRETERESECERASEKDSEAEKRKKHSTFRIHNGSGGDDRVGRGDG